MARYYDLLYLGLGPEDMLIRFIALVYVLMFLAGLSCAVYLLSHTLSLQPIPMIKLLQYLLLCVLFFILIVNTTRAFSLKPADILRFSNSVNNFKWLFLLTALLSIAAFFGMFNTTGQAPVAISQWQIAIVLILCGFCFWSNEQLDKLVDHK